MPSKEDFANELQAIIERAIRQERTHVEVNAGELHRTLGGYPAFSHSMPSCCAAMHDELNRTRGFIVFDTNSGNGASLTIRYEAAAARS